MHILQEQKADLPSAGSAVAESCHTSVSCHAMASVAKSCPVQGHTHFWVASTQGLMEIRIQSSGPSSHGGITGKCHLSLTAPPRSVELTCCFYAFSFTAVHS